MKNNNYVYVIIYDKNSLSSEGYSNIDKAIKHLEDQGYEHFYGWIYCNDKNSAYIKEVKII